MRTKVGTATTTTSPSTTERDSEVVDEDDDEAQGGNDPRARSVYAELQAAKSNLKALEARRWEDIQAKQNESEEFELVFDNWKSLETQIGKQKFTPKQSKEKQKGVECVRCLTRTEAAKRCGDCLYAMYCSANCQREDWAEHKKFCKQWTNLLDIERRFQTDRAALLDHIDRVDAERRAQAAQQQKQQRQQQHAHSHDHGGHSH